MPASDMTSFRSYPHRSYVLPYVGMSGLGQPAPTPFPWAIEPTEDQLKKEKRAAFWEKAALAVGIAGGILGILATTGLLRRRR